MRFDPERWTELLELVNQRLRGVNLECLAWQEVLRRYDRPHTFFYLDPPYHGNESVYGKGIFAEEDFEKLAQVLANIQGQFLLSINDTPQIRAWFTPFYRYQIQTRYNLKGGTGGQVTELLFSNLSPQFLPQLKVA